VQQDPSQRVSAPAIGLLVAGVVSGIGSLLWLVMLIFFSALIFASDDSKDAMIGVGFWIPIALIRLALDGLTIYGALQMRQLASWNMSLGGAIAASLPCSFCCILTMPLGIWAIVVLLNDEVKRDFAAQRQAQG
jgi:hypothetical protein